MIILVNKGFGHVLTLNMVQFRPYINKYINKKYSRTAQSNCQPGLLVGQSTAFLLPRLVL